ncbi:SH3 domain-containing protein [Donghicola mangrovi]|uniref:SH3 domain-containing protein n=1 Tax=Donghicola mangrovi TaxID=2729614 RepID=A0A850QBK9_9RHOB|nr:SH3 domain-containing protein [Donghicola mangrovi]NVO23291.1 SH3 domain-containing protein [Donghicola mangrovi]
MKKYALFTLLPVIWGGIALFSNGAQTPDHSPFYERHQPAELALPTSFTAMIDDRLGYIGVRSGPGDEMPVIGRLYGADIFDVEPEEGDWWRVRHQDGALAGWIPRERIELVDMGGQGFL